MYYKGNVWVWVHSLHICNGGCCDNIVDDIHTIPRLDDTQNDPRGHQRISSHSPSLCLEMCT